MSGKEIKFTKTLCDGIVACNGVVIPYTASMRSRPGVPDRHIIHRYWWGWLEMKDDDGRLSQLQRSIIKQMNDRQPGSAFVIRRAACCGPKEVIGTIEDCDGTVLAEFSGVVEMLKDLRELTAILSSQ